MGLDQDHEAWLQNCTLEELRLLAKRLLFRGKDAHDAYTAAQLTSMLKEVNFDIEEANAWLKLDPVVRPPHYQTETTYETINVLDAWMSPEEVHGFLRGNVLKYLSRAGKKEQALKDYKKARWYLERLIKTLESTQAKERST